MQLSHAWMVWCAEVFGLVYLVAMSVAVTAYAFWPGLRHRFRRAAESVLDDEDGPCR